MRQHGSWRINASREVYRDPWISLRRDEVTRPDGHAGSYAVVHLKPGVCVIALDDRGTVYLTREFHYGVGRTTIEGVSGGIESDEQPLESARRELHEEIGVRAARWTHLATVDPFTANVVSPTHLYLAEGLAIGTPRPEGTEEIERVAMPLDDAIEAVTGGTITHAPSCVALLLVGRLRPSSHEV